MPEIFHTLYKLQFSLQISRNVELKPTFVMMTLIARTLKDLSTARVLRDILEMELRALVSSIFLKADLTLFS